MDSPMTDDFHENVLIILKSFEARFILKKEPSSEIDALVLTELEYLPLEKVVPSE